ncbi:MAG: S8 family serine peptidase [Flavobacteriales bacterium]
MIGIRTTAFLFATLAFVQLFGQRQTKIGIQLQVYLATAEPGTNVDLFLEGDAAQVTRSVLGLHGLPKMATATWLSATLPVEAVPALDNDPAIRSISFSLSKGRALNDSMRVKAHVDEAHQGLAPLPQAYQGEGVLMGIIDTGLDFRHPDFKDSLGNTRVLHYWDQNMPFNAALTPAEYGYGQQWDSTAINVGNCPVNDLAGYGHGTTVGGTAAGNNLGNGHCAGVAPKSDLIVVANDMDHVNWTASIVDAVKYITDIASSLGRPVAINLSLGAYYGSHDGLDPAALMIDQMLTEENGRVLVCAAGNSGSLPPYHLRHEVGADTTFTWFNYNPNSALGIGAMYFDLWADTADFSQVHYSVGADRISPSLQFRGAIPYRQVSGTIGQITMDTLWSVSGNKLGVVHTYAEYRGGQVHMEVYIPQADSTTQNRYRFSTTGSGRFDAWSIDVFGTSKMVVDIPDSASFPAIVNYVLPDSTMQVVDSWACSPNVITVGNYYNQQHYIDVSGTPRDFDDPTGDLSNGSSHGPTRTGLLKPDLASPGDATFSAGPLVIVQTYLINGVDKLIDSLHMRNGGTSIASPSVAGTAALLLEKCPYASNLMVLNAINAAAFGDTFAINLPNNGWGHGKLNTFQALVGTNFNVPVSGPYSACSGDSTKLLGPDFMFDYAWTNEDHDSGTWAQPGDTLQLTVHNTSGCFGRSDTIIITENPLPVATITAVGLELTSTEAAEYQWFLENSPIPGAEGQSLIADENGNYYVRVTDSLGCSANSDTVLVFSVGVGDQVAQGPSVWPVPVSEMLNVRGLGEGHGSPAYQIVDARGRTVQFGVLNSGAPQIAVGKLAPGVYLLRWPNTAALTGLRFVKD